MEYEIKQGIPVPKRGRWGDLLVKMNPGDCIDCPTPEAKKFIQTVCSNFPEWKIISKEVSPGVIRCWKTRRDKARNALSKVKGER